MEVKLLPHENKVEIEFRLLQNCVGTFIFWSFLPVLPHEGLSHKFSSALLTDPSLQTVITSTPLHVYIQWTPTPLLCTCLVAPICSFCPLIFLWVFAPLSPCLVYFHASKLPCFWDYANKNINQSISFSEMIAVVILYIFIFRSQTREA